MCSNFVPLQLYGDDLDAWLQLLCWMKERPDFQDLRPEEVHADAVFKYLPLAHKYNIEVSKDFDPVFFSTVPCLLKQVSS